MNRIGWATLLTLMLSLPVAARCAGQPAQPSECAGAATKYDLTMCASDAADAADRRLNATYEAVLAMWTNHPDVVRKLRAAQRVWISYRDADLLARFAPEDAERLHGVAGTAYPMAYGFYRADLENERAVRLCQYLQGTAVGEGAHESCAELVRQPRVVPSGP